MSSSNSAVLSVNNLHKEFGAVQALTDVNLAVQSGEFLTILGPSGSGKTTLLKLIAGFEAPSSGSIFVEEVDITGIDPSKRDIGMVFQNYALFPHMTVWENIAFPLKMRALSRNDIERAVNDALDLVELSSYGNRKPKQLSGGQQQRVALARAIVFRPKLLLLDEPFGALDRKLREQMQLEVRRLQRKLKLTTIFITHDQEEALMMSDRIAVMSDGRIQQIAMPYDLYEAPNNEFVASFIGESNIVEGKVISTPEGMAVAINQSVVVLPKFLQDTYRQGDGIRMMIRPERFVDHESLKADAVYFEGTVHESVYLGTSYKYRIKLHDSDKSILMRANIKGSRTPYNVGETVSLACAAEDIWYISDGHNYDQ